MVDSINPNLNHPISDLQTGQLQQNQLVQQTNQESAGLSNGASANYVDQANISDTAMARLQSEKEAMKYASTAARMDEPFNSDKVGLFKSMVDSGRINDYLRGLSNSDLAQSMLNSPLGVSLGV